MGKRPEVGFDPAVPRSRRPQQILRIVLGGKILVAQFRVGGKKFFKRAAFRGFHKSRRDQAHPEQGERVVILLARGVVIGEATDAGGHTLGGAWRQKTSSRAKRREDAPGGETGLAEKKGFRMRGESLGRSR